jgi:hypothetical protein
MPVEADNHLLDVTRVTRMGHEIRFFYAAFAFPCDLCFLMLVLHGNFSSIVSNLLDFSMLTVYTVTIRTGVLKTRRQGGQQHDI